MADETLDDEACERSLYQQLNEAMTRLSAVADAERGRDTITMGQHLAQIAGNAWLARYGTVFSPADMPENALAPTPALAHAIWTHPVSRQLRVRVLPLCVAGHTLTLRQLCRTLGECGCVNLTRYAAAMPQFAHMKGSGDYGSGWLLPAAVRVGAQQAYDAPTDLVAGYWVRVLVDPAQDAVRLVRMALFATRPPVKETLEFLEERERKKREKLGAV